MNNDDEYVTLASNDYRNLPQYSKFREKKENPPSTEFGKNYHLFRAKPAEQLSLENTVYNKKMASAGKTFLTGLAVFALGGLASSFLLNNGMSPEVVEYIKSAVVIGSSGLQVAGALKFVGTINGPITIKDVEKYDESIKENWEKEKSSYENRSHGKGR